MRSTPLVSRPWVVRRVEETFGDVAVACKEVLIDAAVLPGFAATVGGRPVGLPAYDAARGECEVVIVFSTGEGRVLRSDPLLLVAG